MADAGSRVADPRIRINQAFERLCSSQCLLHRHPCDHVRQLLTDSNSGNGNLRPETLGAPRRKQSPARAKSTAETDSARAAYGNVVLFQTLGNHVDLRRLPGGAGDSNQRPLNWQRCCRPRPLVFGNLTLNANLAGRRPRASVILCCILLWLILVARQPEDSPQLGSQCRATERFPARPTEQPRIFELLDVRQVA